MPGPPSDLVAEIQQSARDARDGALAGGVRRFNVGINATSHIEAHIRRRIDVDRHADNGHCYGT